MEIYLRLASALHGLEKYDRALATLRRAARRYPDHVEPHIHAGNILVDLQQRAEALAAYRRAVDVNPQSVRACRYLADRKLTKDIAGEVNALGLLATGRPTKRRRTIFNMKHKD